MRLDAFLIVLLQRRQVREPGPTHTYLNAVSLFLLSCIIRVIHTVSLCLFLLSCIIRVIHTVSLCLFLLSCIIRVIHTVSVCLFLLSCIIRVIHTVSVCLFLLSRIIRVIHTFSRGATPAPLTPTRMVFSDDWSDSTYAGHHQAPLPPPVDNVKLRYGVRLSERPLQRADRQYDTPQL